MQGEIESISLMKPKAVHENEPGMLEYIEDIIEKELADILEKKQKNVEEMTSLKAEMEELQSSKKSSQSKLNEVSQEHDAVSKKKRCSRKKASEVMGSLKDETTLLQEKKDKLETELKKLQENVSDIKSEIDLAQSELNICVSGAKKEKEKLSTLKKDQEKNTETTKKEKSLLIQEEEELKNLENEICTSKEQLSNSRQHWNSFAEQVDIHSFSKNERVKLEEAENSQQTSHHSSSLVKALLREKSEGRIPGIYGRLGDLGAIDEKYDIAISTACGRLDNIVTDTITTAQKCVEFLKRNNLGYATFIALDQMKKWEPYTRQQISFPENVPRLFDLVRVKDHALLPAFYFSLQNTLVGSDLEQATRIGLKGRERHRVVTLKGEVIDTTGTMSGGGGRPLKGEWVKKVIECAFSKEDITRMAANVRQLTTKISELKNLCSSLEDQISQKTFRISTLQRSIKKRNQCCKAFTEQIEMINSQIEEQKKKVSESMIDTKKVSFLEEKISTENKATAHEEQVSKLQAEILKISKGNYSKKPKRKMKKLESKIENLKSEIEKNEKVFHQYRDNQEKLTALGSKLNNELTENKEKLIKVKEMYGNIKKEIDAKNEKEHQMKRAEIELKNKIKKIEASESEMNGIIRSYNTKIGKLKLNEVEEDSTEIPTLSNEEIDNLNIKSLSADLNIMKVQLEDMKPDFSAIEAFKRRLLNRKTVKHLMLTFIEDQSSSFFQIFIQSLFEKLYEEKSKDVEQLRNDIHLQKLRHDELRRRRLNEFMAGFNIIAKKLKEVYQMLTLGGDAEIELVDSSDPFKEGIRLSIRPPRKSWKLLRYLSGGEKTLSSLALVFALHYYRPTPFYVMDEIDAALDTRNVAIVGYFLKEHTKNAQFIIISLRNVMNEIADHLLGIYKVNNCTKNISLSNVEKWAEKKPTEEENS
ncbi:structural maintenance of chromosomes protein 4 [Caerostris extrusa]|uniref:Structural maintenance of chromosomes protein 4 n=1 Tax=Caerostris extrusa TaxID=172846 RepID=A0AAV4WYF6_CAEEX|nr:structural maintenance of chromosomes protein 4 [Caerostris extrusa]